MKAGDYEQAESEQHDEHGWKRKSLPSAGQLESVHGAACEVVLKAFSTTPFCEAGGKLPNRILAASSRFPCRHRAFEFVKSTKTVVYRSVPRLRSQLGSWLATSPGGGMIPDSVRNGGEVAVTGRRPKGASHADRHDDRSIAVRNQE